MTTDLLLPTELGRGAAVIRQLLRHELMSVDVARGWIFDRAAEVDGYPAWLEELVDAGNRTDIMTALSRVPGVSGHHFDVTGPFVVSALLAALDVSLTPQRAHVIVTEPYLLTHPISSAAINRSEILLDLAEQFLPRPAR